MQEKHHQKEFEVHYYEVNQYQEATPVSVLNYLEETAIAHSEAVGLGLNRLKSEGIAWVLNRWRVQMERYPQWNEKIIVETWPSHFERFYATRQFYIKDIKGKILGRATSLWIFLNIEKKRPLRIPAEYMLTYGLESQGVFEDPFSELYNLENPEVFKEFYVRRSDIDTNEHVNNTKYMEWVLETVPAEIYKNHILQSFEVIYKKEVGLGSIISAASQPIEELGKPTFAHTIKEKNQDYHLALAETRWVKRIKER
ncbi:acyl-[acyl-carrier-protein] thioesterase [Desulfotomaculum sp. 1211_IL3151]|uniref:acyl-[acyl-carrier-protein] thioesterase n=1 Tax=Desulfotomaculum sp. 1211_IL3151 TaxID=3084055 RepID=UPI002FD8C972